MITFIINNFEKRIATKFTIICALLSPPFYMHSGGIQLHGLIATHLLNFWLEFHNVSPKGHIMKVIIAKLTNY